MTTPAAPEGDRSTARHRARPARRVPRSKLTGLLAAIAMVTVAAVGYHLSDPIQNFSVVRGTLGEPVPFADGSVLVDDVRVGTVAAVSTTEQISTPGLFVVLQVSARASGPEDIAVNHLQLVAEGATYKAAEDESVNADPGFAETRDVRFEVDPDRIDDLTLEGWRTQGFVEGYNEHFRVPLGITPGNAAAWRQAAAGSLVDYVQNPVGSTLR